jgi:hypothetical protein
MMQGNIEVNSYRLLWIITEANGDLWKCRHGIRKPETGGEGPPIGEPQREMACRGATGEGREKGARGEAEMVAKNGEEEG